MQDRGYPELCKIGKDSHWPQRYKQARCYTPRGIDISAVWHFDGIDLPTLNRLEKEAQRGLECCREGAVREWFRLSGDAAAAVLTERFGRSPDAISNPPVPIWDDWRQRSDVSRSNGVARRYRRRLWVFQEEGKGGCLKIAHNTFWDSNFGYKFTYNPRHVRWRAGFEHPSSFGGPSEALAEPNRQIVAVWEEATHRYGWGPEVAAMGWLRPGTTLDAVCGYFLDRGLRPTDVRSKPPDCLPLDPSYG